MPIAAASIALALASGLLFAPGATAVTPADLGDDTGTSQARLRPSMTVNPDPGTTPEEAIQEASDVLAGKSEGDATRALNDATQVLANDPTLSPAERGEAERLFARPTDPDSPIDLFTYGSASTSQICSTNICVRYATEGTHKATPAWATETLNTFQSVWEKEVGDFKFRAPLSDGTKGGNAKLDVYIGNIDRQGVYGYAVSDSYTRRQSSAYLVVDNDYAAFPNRTPKQNLQVTAAHEFFHAVQYAYDQMDDAWFMEATAVWIEEQVYDSINDNRQYLPYSSARRPGLSLDLWSSTTPYGQWAFFQYASERYDLALIRNMWWRASQSGVYSLKAMNDAIKARSSAMDLRKMFAAWTIGNNVPTSIYSEGSAYKNANYSKSWALRSSRLSTGEQRLRLDHLAARNYVVRPGKGMGAGTQLRLSVDGPGTITDLRYVVIKKNGTRSFGKVWTNSAGRGAKKLWFNKAKVARVKFSIVNTSTGMDCNQGSFSCNGYPRHDDKLFTFTAKAIR